MNRTSASNDENELNRARILKTAGVLAGAWGVVLLFRGVVPTAAGLYALAAGPHPYWQPAHALLLYVAVPVVALASLLVVLTPGLLLTLAIGASRDVGEWVLKALALSLLLVGTANAAFLAVTTQPMTASHFFATLGALSVACFLFVLLRVPRDRIAPWPLAPANARALVVSMVVAPALLLAVLAPKFLWESFNGDGVHAFEAARLLTIQPVPFWDPAAGAVAKWPGVTSMLFMYPLSWFIHIFGPIEFAARLPFVLYLIAVFGGIVALCTRSDRLLHSSELYVVWLALAGYAVVVAYSVTYSPYSADMALPGAQDTLLVAWLLGFILATANGWRFWTVLFAVCCYFTLPNGLVLIGFWWLAMLFLWRPIPWRSLALIAVTCIGCVAAGALAPPVLAALGQTAPGGELATSELFGRFNWLQLTDWRRFLYLAVPCGILPAFALLAWRRQDTLSRTVTATTFAYFALTYVQAYASLHYYIPSMLLPLVVFWRNEWVAAPRRKLVTAAAAAAAVASLWLSRPEHAAPYSGARLVGRAIENRIAGYPHPYAEQLRSTGILTELFPNDWDPLVPRRALGGSPLAWNYYAHVEPKQIANYIVQRASDPPVANAVRIAQRDGFAVFVRDTTIWHAQRAMRPPSPAGARIFQVSRAVLFHSGSGEDGFRIINVRSVLKRLRSH